LWKRREAGKRRDEGKNPDRGEIGFGKSKKKGWGIFA